MRAHIRRGQGFWLLFLLGVVPTAAQDRPLRTPDATIVPAGVSRVQIGFDFLQDIRFPLSGLRGDLTSIGVLQVRTGLGRIVEIQLEGEIQNFLSVTQQSAAIVTPELTGPRSTRGVGDFRSYTKVRLFAETAQWPAFAFRFGFQMPTADQRRGIGTNTTNLFAELILEKHFGKLQLFGDIGLGIFEAPAAQFSQNDVLLYGLALTYPVHTRVRLVGEVAGFWSARDTTGALVGTDSRAQGRIGLQVKAGGFFWDVAGVAGVYRNDPRTGFTFGIRKDIRLFGNRTNP
jgi:hypothetical protein